MSLADVIHTGVAVANRLTQSEGMQVTVQHAAATEERDDNGRPVLAAAVDRTGLLHTKPRRVLDTTGAERMSRAQFVVLGPVVFNTEDRVTLPHPQGGSAWTAAEADQRVRALLQATRLLDAHVGWTGHAARINQALAWPRDGMYDRNDYGLDAGVIPPALRDATAEFARHLLHAINDRTADSSVVSSGIRELVAGSVELTFTGDRPDVIPDAVWFLLVPSWLARVRQRSKRTAAAVPVVRT